MFQVGQYQNYYLAKNGFPWRCRNYKGQYLTLIAVGQTAKTFAYDI